MPGPGLQLTCLGVHAHTALSPSGSKSRLRKLTGSVTARGHVYLDRSCWCGPYVNLDEIRQEHFGTTRWTEPRACNVTAQIMQGRCLGEPTPGQRAWP